jgi:Aspartyl protease/PDZ domain
MINARRRLPIAVALLFYVASIAIAQSATEQPIEIPFRLVENVVWFQVRINNSRPLNFLLDTAASTDVVNWRVAEELDLPLFAMRTRANVGAGDGVTETAFAPNVHISLGDTNYQNPRMGVVPLDSISRSFGEPFDGVLGYDLLSRWVVTIDYQQHELVLHSNEAFEYKGSGRIIPLRPSFGVPIATGTLVLDGKEYSGDFIIDAPARGSVTLATPFIKGNGLLDAMRSSGRRLLETELRGAGGTSRNALGRVSAFRFAGVTFESPIVGFANATGGAFARRDIAGNIGAEILHHFRVTLDYPHGQLILEPFETPNVPEADMSGITWESEPPSHNTLTAVRVQDNSPAGEAGVKVGDVLVSFNDRPAAEIRKWQLAEALKRPGEEVRLVVKRGEQEVSLRLVLRRLI